MAIEKTELFGTLVTQTPLKRVLPKEAGIRIGRFGPISAAPTIKHLTALAWDTAGELWVPFRQGNETSEVYNVASASTPATAGDFTLTLVSYEDEDGVVILVGETTPVIAFDALPAVVEAALAQISVLNTGNLLIVMTAGTDLGDASAVMRIDFEGNLDGRKIVVTADMTGLTGNDHVLSNPIEASGYEVSRLDGFLFAPDGEFAAHATNDRLVAIFREGQIHIEDTIIHDTGVAPVSADEPFFQTLRVRSLGIIINGLADTP